KVGTSAEILSLDALSFIKSTKKKFDIIFLDPPYNKGFIEPILSEIVKNELLLDGGIVVLESDDTDFSAEFEGLDFLKQRKYGRTFITIYQKETENE
ncbi:MAG: RsmD family RNA methyltransferase, partial [Clostridia bacterium]|nr:RsmD family RNA methyltransferase [Clostridia bacterium]